MFDRAPVTFSLSLSLYLSVSSCICLSLSLTLCLSTLSRSLFTTPPPPPLSLSVYLSIYLSLSLSFSPSSSLFQLFDKHRETARWVHANYRQGLESKAITYSLFHTEASALGSSISVITQLSQAV